MLSGPRTSFRTTNHQTPTRLDLLMTQDPNNSSAEQEARLAEFRQRIDDVDKRLIAALSERAEIVAEVILKATQVDSVYNADPAKVASAVRYERLTFDEAMRACRKRSGNTPAADAHDFAQVAVSRCIPRGGAVSSSFVDEPDGRRAAGGCRGMRATRRRRVRQRMSRERRCARTAATMRLRPKGAT